MPEIVKLEHSLEDKKAVEYFNMFFDVAAKLERGWAAMGNEGSGVDRFLQTLSLMIGYHWMSEEGHR